MTRPPLYVRRPFLAGLIRQLPLLAVLVVVGIGLLDVTLEHWRRGLVLVGLALIGAAVMRALLPVPASRATSTGRLRTARKPSRRTGIVLTVVVLTIPFP